MKFFRTHIISRIFCFVMALHIFNVCIDTPDAQPESVAEDLSVNDMESIVEVVLEKGLGIDNAIAEHDDQDDNDAQDFEMSKDFKFFRSTFKNPLVSLETIVKNIEAPYKEPHYLEYSIEIPPRPPQA